MVVVSPDFRLAMHVQRRKASRDNRSRNRKEAGSILNVANDSAESPRRPQQQLVIRSSTRPKDPAHPAQQRSSSTLGFDGRDEAIIPSICS